MLPTEAVSFRFVTSDASKTATSASSLPTCVVIKNGVTMTGLPVNVQLIGVGEYTASFSIPVDWLPGDFVQVMATFEIGGLTQKQLVWDDELEALRLGDTYHGEIEMTIDEGNARDIWSFQWFLNGNPIQAAPTDPKITVYDLVAESVRIDNVAMVPVAGANGFIRLLESANRIAAGNPYSVTVTSTINGATRTWKAIFSRDSVP